MEVGKLKKRITDFETKQNEFRKSFQKMRFYQFKCRSPYELLAEANGMIDSMEINMKTLQVSVVLAIVMMRLHEDARFCLFSGFCRAF